MSHICWGDFETGGLIGRQENNVIGEVDYPIFECAFVITDSELNEVSALQMVAHQPEHKIEMCDPWALENHEKSGLLAEVRESNTTLAQAQDRFLAWLAANNVQKYDPELKKGAVFAGNSIMLDRSFMNMQMKQLSDYFHYRQLDVSAIETAYQLFTGQSSILKKQRKHRALDDIRESIEQARFYKHLFTHAVNVIQEAR